VLIRPFDPADEDAVVALWERCGLTRPWNDPRKDIRRKLAVRPEQFLVGVLEGMVIATAMAGYDGHRGWVYYFGVDPEHQRKGHGRTLLGEVEQMLLAEGCPKVNLQVRTTNHEATAFYERVGYTDNVVRSLGKRLVPDGPNVT
jgi:ribosomal protein S18 acetylase RimI-like enzyme